MNRLHYLTTLSLILSLVWLPTLSVGASSAGDKAKRLALLKQLDIEDLLEVEIKLDDVFDVFDGLVKAQKVSVATGTEQTTARAPAVTSVITSQDIEASGAKDLDEILESVPGLHVSVSNIGYTPIYSIRGVYSSFNPEVLVLVNGIPINNVYIGNRGQAWGGMPVNSISRVEIIRGPGSAVFGADAFSGVINVITKNRKDINGTEAGVRYGSFDTQNGWLLHGETWNGIDTAITLEYSRTEGHEGVVERDVQSLFDEMYGTSASLAPGPVHLHRNNFDMRVELSKGLWTFRSGYQRRRDYGMGAGSDQALDDYGYYVDDRFSSDLTYHNPKFTDNWDVTVQGSFFRSGWATPVGQNLYPPGAFGGAFPQGLIGGPSASERDWRFEASGFYSGIANHTVRIGMGYHIADLYKSGWFANFLMDPDSGAPMPLDGIQDFSDTPMVFVPEGKRRNWSLFAQDIWNLASGWDLTTGLRYDRYSDFGSTLNPRMALVWQTQPNLTSKLLFGRAFRAPSFLEQYGANNPVARGNPELEPETVRTLELAFDYRASETLYITTNLFNYHINDGIDFMPDAEGTATAHNAVSQSGYGVEFEARWKTSTKSSVLFNYAYQSSKYKDTDEPVANVPAHMVYLRSDWLLYPNWYLDAQLNWLAGRKRASDDPRADIDDYYTIDTTLRYKDVRKGGWNFALGVRNLFDADVREPSAGPDLHGIVGIPYDLPMAGRSYFTELRYRF